MLAMREREAFAGMPEASTAALSYAKDGISVFGHLVGSLNQDKNQPWFRSVPSRTTIAQRGKRPGTEERARTCDAHHTNFITAARNVERRS